MRAGRRGRSGDARQRHSGYMLLILMLAVAVMTIMALQVARNYRASIRREREVEMIHRGAQYARAVQLYYRQFHVFPTSIEQLENTNEIRFLRKRYKDPMSADGQWKIAHLTDIKLSGFTATGMTPAVTASPASNALGVGATAGASGSGLTLTGGSATQPNTPGADGASATSTSTDNSSSAFGGAVLGPMLGVISKSTAKGIHEFNGKSHYNDWYFIYVPAQDTGQALSEPYNPSLPVGGTAASTGAAAGKSGSDASPTSTTGPAPAPAPVTAPANPQP